MLTLLSLFACSPGTLTIQNDTPHDAKITSPRGDDIPIAAGTSISTSGLAPLTGQVTGRTDLTITVGAASPPPGSDPPPVELPEGCEHPYGTVVVLNVGDRPISLRTSEYALVELEPRSRTYLAVPATGARPLHWGFGKDTSQTTIIDAQACRQTLSMLPDRQAG